MKGNVRVVVFATSLACGFLPASDRAAQLFNENGGVITIETDDFSNNVARSSHQWITTNTLAGFSGTGYVEATPDDGTIVTNNITTTSPELQFAVNFNSTGIRYIWIRGNAPDPAGDSLQAGLDSSVTATNITFFEPNDAWVWTNRTSAGNAATFNVSTTGGHRFNLWMREDGMRIDKIVLTTNATFSPTVGNVFHIPLSMAEQDLVNAGIPSMRNPYSAIFSNAEVSFYTGNQFQGSGNPGNQLGVGSTLLYKKSTDTTWNSLPMTFFMTGVSNPNNKYYSATFTNNFSPGDTVQYYFKIPYSDHLTTYVYGNDAQRFNTEIESLAQASPFAFTVKTAPPNVTASPADWRDLNIYQVITDRYYDGDPSNNMANPDGVFDPAGGSAIHGGDFKGLQQKLDYIKALGANAIWISPIVYNTFAQYHGYSGWDFYSIDPHWGTFADLTNMIASAHQRDIYVILDMVCNHGGDLIDSTEAGYLTMFKTPPAGYNMRFKTNKTYPPPFDTNAINPTISSLFHTNGLVQDFNNTTQVELGELRGLDDFRTELNYIRTNFANMYQYWISAADFDGFRVDTTKHIEHAFWQFWCPQIHQYGTGIGKTNFFFFGETLTGSDSAVGIYTGSKNGGNYEYDSMLDYALYFTINPVFANANGNTKQIEDHYNAIAANYDTNAWFRLITFLDNHDQSRFLSSGNANNDTNRLAVALAFLYTSRGIPCLYYGTEQAFNGVKDSNNSNREDMFAGQFPSSGPSVGDNFDMTHPLFRYVAMLNNFRRLYPSLRRGGHRNLWNTPGGPGLFAYSRTNDNEEVFVVFNTAVSTQTLTPRATIYPQSTVLVNLVDTNETIAVVAGPTTPQISVPAMSIKLFIAQSLLKPIDPVILSQTPAHAETNVSPLAQIVLKFSKRMDTNSVQAAFSLIPPTTGALTWSGTTTMTFTAAGMLPVSTTNVVRVATNATDSVSGNSFFAPFETYFVTGPTTGNDISPPSVAINSPGNGSTISGPLAVSGTATDGVLVAKVEIQLDGGLWLAATGATVWSATLNSENFLNGLHVLSARATDSSGNVSSLDSRTVRFVNVPGNYALRISPGSFADVTNCDGTVWIRDQSYNPGSFGFMDGSPGYVGDRIAGIPCVDGQQLYERERFGASSSSFRYFFDCPEGIYETTMLESETRTNVVNGRKFNVFIQNQQVLTNLDIFASTGGMDLPLVRVFTNTITNAQVQIEFTPVTYNSRAGAIQVRRIADIFSDNDGIPDWWRRAYFGHPTGQAGDLSRADDDPDGDGFTNLQEYLSGTDPTDSTSTLRITKIENVGTDVQVNWTSAAGKAYRLQKSDAPGNMPWMDVGSVVNGTGGVVIQTDTGAATNGVQQFYRVRLVP